MTVSNFYVKKIVKKLEKLVAKNYASIVSGYLSSLVCCVFDDSPKIVSENQQQQLQY